MAPHPAGNKEVKDARRLAWDSLFYSLLGTFQRKFVFLNCQPPAQELWKDPGQTRWAGGTACPTTEYAALVLVAQAVPPAISDFFTASYGAVAGYAPVM